MPYIGNTIRAADDYRLIDDISSSFNGSTTSFALQVAGSAPVPFPKSPQQVLISVNGVIQEPDPTGSSGFNLVGTNIVFSSAPTNGHAFFGIIYATADYLNAGGNFPSGSLGAPSFTFIGDENTGLYRKSGGSVGFVSDATEIANFDSNGITISSGNLIIPGDIIHSGDTNTKIRFSNTDEIKVETGGVQRLKLDGGEVVFNDDGADVDFRIEGDSNANLFKVDAGNDRIGVGTATPSTPLHVVGTIHGSTNIGIRTTSPSNNLHIHQDDSDKSIAQFTNTVTGTASGDGFQIGITSSEEALLNMKESKPIIFKTSDTERLRLDANGLLGLGNDSPSARLSVKDTATFTAYASAVPSVGACMQQLQNSPSSEAINNHASIQFGVNGGTHNRVNSISAVAESASNRKLAFTFCTDSGSNRNERLRISADGHVLPGADSTYNIGSNSNRFANGYFDTLYGDGSNLTGITSTTINNNANNRLITGSGSANTLEGEADLNYSKESTSNHMLVLGGTDNTAAAWSSTRQGFKAIGSQPLLYLVDNDNTSGDDAYVGHAGSVLYVAKRGGSVAFQTSASGGSTTTRWTIGTTGHLEPNSTSDALDIGSSSKRVANIYTNDLHLSNEGHSNDVDGTWGSYTIQEGVEDLFLINKRNGKKYKFNLMEVS